MSTCGCHTFAISAGANAPVLEDTLTDAEGTVIDLTDKTLSFVAVHRLYKVRITKTPVAVDPETSGQVTVAFEPGDLQGGEYDYQYLVTDEDDAVTVVPAYGYFTLTVTDLL